jgi:flagellin-like protein
MRKIKNRKGVSPVVASLLLVVIVIILALIIFIWARSFVTEVITKKDKPSSQVCNEIRLQASYDSNGGKVYISNIGNYPIHDIELRLKKGGSSSIYFADNSQDDKSFPLPLGSAREISSPTELGGFDEVEVIPIILGENSKGKHTQYTCKENIILAENI